MILERISPPGYNYEREKKIILVLLILSVFLSLGFIAEYISALNKLYYYDGGRRILRDTVVCAKFANLCKAYFHGFTITALTSICFAAIRYTYLFQTSKSIYTVRRLPVRASLFKVIFPAPVLYAAAVIIIKYVLIGLYAFIYYLVTPDKCLQPQWLQGIWRL